MLPWPVTLTVLVGVVLPAFSAACGDGPDIRPTPTAEPTVFDGWGPYRALVVGDCIAPPEVPISKVSCDSPTWYARVYAIRNGPEAVGPCPPADPSISPALVTSLNIPTGDPLLLCLILRQPISPD
jgi:hypothetical protein